MHTRFPLSFLLGLALASAGCQHLAYREPSGATTASITFTSDNVAVQPVICVPGDGFESTYHAVSQQPFEAGVFRELNASLRKKEEVTVRVNSARPAVVGFAFQQPHRSGPREQCKVAARFQPGADMDYRAHFTLEGRFCGLRLTDGNGVPVADAVVVPWRCP